MLEVGGMYDLVPRTKYVLYLVVLSQVHFHITLARRGEDNCSDCAYIFTAAHVAIREPMSKAVASCFLLAFL